MKKLLIINFIGALFVSMLIINCGSVSLAESKQLGSSKNLIRNGDFSDGMEYWTETFGRERGERGTRTTDIIVSDLPYTNVLEVKSTNNGGCGGLSGRWQTITIDDTSLYDSIVLKVDVKIVSAGTDLIGGWKGHEYPIHLFVDIKNSDNSATTWEHGLYHRDSQGGEVVDPANSTKINTDQWYKYTSPNLKNLFPKGKVTVTVRVCGNGWNYQGMIDNVGLIAGPVDPSETKSLEQQIKNLIIQLGDNNLQKRESAQAELIKTGEPSIILLYEALKKTTSPEVKMRLQKILIYFILS